MDRGSLMTNGKMCDDKGYRKLQLGGIRRAISNLRLFPKNHDFFSYYQRSGETIVLGVKLLCRMIKNKDERHELLSQLKGYENTCDTITHEVIDILHSTFLTPFDRGDMHTLIVKMDDILDFAYYVGNRLTRYDVKETPEELSKLAEILCMASEECAVAVMELKNISNSEKILNRCIAIKGFENEADETMNKAIERIFHSGWDPLEVIKVKELMENLESAADKCEDVANIIESIILKHV